MANSAQRRDWIRGTSLRAGSAALALAVVLGLAAVATTPAQSQTFTVLYTFTGGSDGSNPYGAGLILDAAGNLYGTTVYGGGGGCVGGAGCGVVFKLDSTGHETVLHSFAGGSTDGANPYSGNLLMDTKGNLYGVTKAGGSSNEGVVYKLSRSGTLTVLHSFTGGTTDGCSPFGTPIMDKKGNVYGTTWACGSSDRGIVWKVSRKAAETVLYSFTESNGAVEPLAGVILDTKGNLYGDTFEDEGTVYELNKKGNLTVLHKFSVSDGAYPMGDVIRDAKGTLYGTTWQGGDLNCNSGYGCGVVFKLTPH